MYIYIKLPQFQALSRQHVSADKAEPLCLPFYIPSSSRHYFHPVSIASRVFFGRVAPPIPSLDLDPTTHVSTP